MKRYLSCFLKGYPRRKQPLQVGFTVFVLFPDPLKRSRWNVLTYRGKGLPGENFLVESVAPCEEFAPGDCLCFLARGQGFPFTVKELDVCGVDLMPLPNMEAGLEITRQELLDRARQGQAQARDKLLEIHRYFVFRVASSFCRRRLDWGRDDELSIALLAFNEAIDRYREEKGVPFLVYARQVIKTRLIDLQRREKRWCQHEISFDSQEDGENWKPVECELARENYCQEMLLRERAAELGQYEKLLGAFGLSLAEVARASPKHRDRRCLLVRVARQLVDEPMLFSYLEEKKKLPVQELTRIAGVSPKTIERGRKYIVALSLILGYPEEFSYLNSYLVL